MTDWKSASLSDSKWRLSDANFGESGGMFTGIDIPVGFCARSRLQRVFQVTGWSKSKFRDSEWQI